MTRWTVLMIAAAAALTQPALAQTSDGVPGDRVVVPLPDVSGLSDDEAQALARDAVTLAVQVNGKVRGRVTVPADAPADAVESAALADEKVVAFLDGKTPKKVIVVAGRLVNVVV